MERWIARPGADQGQAEKLALEWAEKHHQALPSWIAELLCRRGADSVGKADAFLDPSLRDLASPNLLPGLEDAVRTLENIRREKGKQAYLAVYGDYDVDGVVASVIMKEALEAYFGFEPGSGHVRIYIPDRHEEGYGLNMAAVEKLCLEADAIVTVDCGITSVAECERVMSNEPRRYMIVTDHHTLPETLPRADALVNPKLSERFGLAPCDPLCGAGVALKLGGALCGERFRDDHLDLCALATVADMVELTGDNRVIVSEGLKRLRTQPYSRPGLVALLRVSGLEEKEDEIDAGDIGFRLAPRLNAAGRLENAKISADLLQTDDPDTAQRLALSLEKLNTERQGLVKEVQQQAMEQVDKMDLGRRFAIVAAGEGWESGVVGLAAGKIAELTGYPTVCLCIQGDMCVGSARSASGIDLYQALSSCADLFDRFGGHKQAAGLTMPLANLETFRERLSDAVHAQMLSMGKAELCREVYYDMPLELADVTMDTVSWLEKMEPFGMGNPAPRFLISDCEAVSLRPVGKEGAHLQGIFRAGDREVKGICFGRGDLAADLAGMRTSLVMRMVRNVFRGRESAEMQLDAIRLSDRNALTKGPDPAQKQDFALCLSNGKQIDPDGVLHAFLAVSEIRQAAGQGQLLVVCPSDDAAKAVREALPRAHCVTFSGTAGIRGQFGMVLVVEADGSPGESALPAALKLTGMPRVSFRI